MPTGNERFFDENEIIVSKTDTKGRMTYCNDIFVKVSGYSTRECIGQQHSLIRHPDMPRCVFKLLWDTISSGNEIFAYVINQCKNGDYYWVNAHVTPSRDKNGQIVGYHSNRRVPNRQVLETTIIPLYKTLLAEEAKFSNSKEGLAASSELVKKVLGDMGLSYEEFFASLENQTQKIAA